MLWAIIVDTHIIENFGPAGEDMARLAKKKMQNHFEAMVQSPDESLQAFTNRFLDQLTRLDLVGFARPPAADLAITFMDMLDYARHKYPATSRDKLRSSLISKMIGAAKADGSIARSACLLCNSSEHNLSQCNVVAQQAL